MPKQSCYVRAEFEMDCISICVEFINVISIFINNFARIESDCMLSDAFSSVMNSISYIKQQSLAIQHGI